jgi:hypothetical protein
MNDRLMRQFLTAPPDATIDERKKRFAGLNDFISTRGGWVTSVPAAPDPLRFEVLPGSPLPEQLTELGWVVRKSGTSQRILPHAISQRLTVRPDGTLGPLIEGSSAPPALVVTNAGIAVVEQYDLRMPPIDVAAPVRIPGTRKPKPPRHGSSTSS